MKVSEQIAIIKAYEDGKTIEGKGHKETEWKILEYVENYPFNFVMNEYRIKPEPKYRPYESVDEAFNEAEKHGFWVKSKDKHSSPDTNCSQRCPDSLLQTCLHFCSGVLLYIVIPAGLQFRQGAALVCLWYERTSCNDGECGFKHL